MVVFGAKLSKIPAKFIIISLALFGVIFLLYIASTSGPSNDIDNLPPVLHSSSSETKPYRECPRTTTTLDTMLVRETMGVYFDVDDATYTIKVPEKYTSIVIDIGANNGDEAASFSQDKNTLVIAFEPQPKHMEGLRKIASDAPNGNMVHVMAAVGDTSAIARFMQQRFDASSSLLSIDTNAVPSYLKGMSNVGQNYDKNIFDVTNYFPSIVIKANALLDMIPKDLPIKTMWVDAQGMDWHIVKSLTPENLKRVERFHIEFMLVPLYAGQSQETLEDVRAYLAPLGYTVTESNNNKMFVDLDIVRTN